MMPPYQTAVGTVAALLSYKNMVNTKQKKTDKQNHKYLMAFYIHLKHSAYGLDPERSTGPFNFHFTSTGADSPHPLVRGA